MGKIVFSDSYKKFNYLYTDKPLEDPKNFKKEAVMGKNLYFRAYLDKPVSVTHPGAWLNISYEINGKKSDREELRSKSGAFSKKIKRFDSDNSKFCPSVKSLISVEKCYYLGLYTYINTCKLKMS